MLTYYGKEMLGFRQMSADETIQAAFHRAEVYSIQGITLEQGTVLIENGVVNGKAYTAGISSELNLLSGYILGDDYTDDEDAWLKEHKCTPPFLLLYVGPTTSHSCVGGWIKDTNEGLATLDCFRPAKDELQASLDVVLPALITALTVKFSSESQRVRFNHVSRCVYGITTQKRTLHDIVFSATANGTVARLVSTASLLQKVAESKRLAEQIDPKVSKFFMLALEEIDPLKRFLYFFLSIEIETNRTYSSLSEAELTAVIAVTPARLTETVASFAKAQAKNWTSLGDRFVVCAVVRWNRVSDAEIAHFFRMKKVRNLIAHGTIAVPDAEAVRTVELLASLLQSPTDSGDHTLAERSGT